MMLVTAAAPASAEMAPSWFRPIVPTRMAPVAAQAAPRLSARAPMTFATPRAAQGASAPSWAQTVAARQSETFVENRGIWAPEMKGLTPATAGISGASQFIRNRWTYFAATPQHQEHWVGLAQRLMPKDTAHLAPQATSSQAAQLFADMKKADIGTNIPEDGCYARADVAAVAGERAGFQMYKVNVVAPAGTKLTVATSNAVAGKVSWGYHVAPAVKVGGQLMVIDPSTADRPLPVAQWKALMNNPKAQVVVTGADQAFYNGVPLTGDARVKELAKNLAIVAAVRNGYEPLRAHALVDAAGH